MSIFAELKAGVTTANAAGTQALAERLARVLPVDSTLALHGNLGVGKTTFVQGLARAFGVTDSVTSPTFTIFTLHRGHPRTLVHLDAYRLQSGTDLEALMLEDFLATPYCLAVEWPENIADWLPADTFHLTLSIVDDRHHHVMLA